jgi:hypothetical protein
MEDQKQATKAQLKNLLDLGFLEREKYDELVSGLDHAEPKRSDSSWGTLDTIIVCFFADGSDKYTEMTILAVTSFLEKTPRIKVGLLTHEEETRDRVLRSVKSEHHERIKWRKTSEIPHLVNWNPTQYKLDIAQFSNDGFECIFWMDSDTLTYGDMTQFLLRFAESNKQFFFVKDHVMFNSDFVSNWTRERALGIIPQACFMGFKYNIIHPFFSLWKSTWEKWISPLPFYHYPDPNPNFMGSMFCIEQYALAMALSQFLDLHNLGDDAIMLFERELILLQHDGRMSFDVVTKIPAMVGAEGLPQMSLSGINLSGVNLSSIGYRMSGLRLSGLNASGLLSAFSGLNISGINVSGGGLTSGLNLSGVNVSGLLSQFGVSGLNTSGLNLSGLNLSGLNASGLNYLFGLLSNVSGLNFSGLNFSGLLGSGVSASGLSVAEFLSRLNVSGLNVSGLNLSGLTLSEFEKMLAGASVNLSGIDYKYLQGAPSDVSSPFASNIALVDKFGGAFIHYYHQNFDHFAQQEKK